jgi:hypothetical protein
MKKTDMAKGAAKKLLGGERGVNATFGGSAPAPVDRKEQRKRDQALGLVPFAVKLNGDLVAQLHAQAKERGVEMNELVGELLAKALA